MSRNNSRQTNCTGDCVDSCIESWIEWLDKVHEDILCIRDEVDACDVESGLEDEINLNQFYDAITIVDRALRLALDALYASED